MTLPLSDTSRTDVMQFNRCLAQISAAQTKFDIDVSAVAKPQEDALPLMALAQGTLSNAFELYEAAKNKSAADLAASTEAPDAVEQLLTRQGYANAAQAKERLRKLIRDTPINYLRPSDANTGRAEFSETQAAFDEIDALWAKDQSQFDTARMIADIATVHGISFVSDAEYHQHWIDQILASDGYADHVAAGGKGYQRNPFEPFTQKAIQADGPYWQFDIWIMPVGGYTSQTLCQTKQGLMWYERDGAQRGVVRFLSHPDKTLIQEFDEAALIPPTDPAMLRELARLKRASDSLSAAAAKTRRLPAADEITRILAPKGVFGMAYYYGGMGCADKTLAMALKRLALPLIILVFTWFGPINVQSSLAKLGAVPVFTLTWAWAALFVLGWGLLVLATMPKLLETLGLYLGTFARGMGWFPRFADNLPGTGETNRIVAFLDRIRRR